ncbi:hypothetical protein D3C73_741680 [compost metagenome]
MQAFLENITIEIQKSMLGLTPKFMGLSLLNPIFHANLYELIGKLDHRLGVSGSVERYCLLDLYGDSGSRTVRVGDLVNEENGSAVLFLLDIDDSECYLKWRCSSMVDQCQ